MSLYHIKRLLCGHVCMYSMYVHTYICTYVHTYTHTVHMYVCTYIHTCVCMYVLCTEGIPQWRLPLTHKHAHTYVLYNKATRTPSCTHLQCHSPPSFQEDPCLPCCHRRPVHPSAQSLLSGQQGPTKGRGEDTEMTSIYVFVGSWA